MNQQAFSRAMETPRDQSQGAEVSPSRLWTGRILQGVAVLFMVVDGGMKLFKPPVVVEGTVQLGYPESAIVPIGIALLVCTLLYAIRRTEIFGAILLTGYLGGAVASNVRAGTPLFNLAFPVLFAVLVWAALTLRNPRLESLLFGGKGEDR
jgi:DoxX-like family